MYVYNIYGIMQSLSQLHVYTNIGGTVPAARHSVVKINSFQMKFGMHLVSSMEGLQTFFEKFEYV